MKTYTSALFALALTAAYAKDHSPKASKRDISMSMSIEIEYSSDFTVLSKSAKSAKKAKSDQSRRVLQVDISNDDESMRVNIENFISKSRKVSIDSKSAKKASSSDDVEVTAKSKSSKDEEDVVSKSSKEGKSFQYIGPEVRSTEPLKSQSYIEYSRAKLPESASEDTNGSIAVGVVGSLSVLITASVVAMN